MVVFLILDLLVIAATIGVWSWKLNRYQKELNKCTRKTSDSCKRLAGLVALYTLTIILMSIVNLIGWLLVCCCENTCCVVTFLVLTLMALILAIILVAIYHDYGKWVGDKNANIIIGSLTLAMNLSLLIIGCILIIDRCDGGSTGFDD